MIKESIEHPRNFRIFCTAAMGQSAAAWVWHLADEVDLLLSQTSKELSHRQVGVSFRRKTQHQSSLSSRRSSVASRAFLSALISECSTSA